MKKILVGPIDIPGTFYFESGNWLNPGMGGSEFHSINLASYLSDNFKVTLWARKGILLGANFEVVDVINEFESFDLQISFTSHSNSQTSSSTPLVVISHHPFDRHVLELPQRTIAIANIGRYQLLSNKQFAEKRKIVQFWLPAFYNVLKDENQVRTRSQPLIAGHLSSLHPSKGFNDVLKGWLKYSANSSKLGVLRVVGGIGLYGSSESHNLYPVGREYGQRLEKTMRINRNSKVEFLGRIQGDITKEVQTWSVALLNPKGIGESECVSMKDCWREGVPVIAGNRFGQRDHMKFFPELSIGLFQSIPMILSRLDREPELLIELSKKSLIKYQELAQMKAKTISHWNELLFSALSNGDLRIGTYGRQVGKISARDLLDIQIDKLFLQSLLLLSFFYRFGLKLFRR